MEASRMVAAAMAAALVAGCVMKDQSSVDLEEATARHKQTVRENLGAQFQHSTTARNPDGSVRESTSQERMANPGALGQALLNAYGGDPSKAGVAARVLGAMSGNEDAARAGALASGMNLGPDFAATTARADQLIAARAASNLRLAKTAANIGNHGSLLLAEIPYMVVKTCANEILQVGRYLVKCNDYSYPYHYGPAILIQSPGGTRLCLKDGGYDGCISVSIIR